MRIEVNIKLDNQKIAKLEEACLKALEMTAEAVLSDIRTSAVVPRDNGELERSGFVDLSDIKNAIARIVFDTPYARRLYWHPEYNFRTDKNVNAKGKWMEDYLSGEKKQFVIDTYSKFLKMLGKGLID